MIPVVAGVVEREVDEETDRRAGVVAVAERTVDGEMRNDKDDR